MGSSVAKTYQSALLEIVEKFYAENDSPLATARDIAAWAIQRKEWEPNPKKLTAMCASDLADAMRTQMHTDAQGRSVRTYAAARRLSYGEDGKPTQEWLWGDVRKGNYEHFLESVRQRESQIAGDIARLKDDVASFNDNHLPIGYEPIQLSLTFTWPTEAEVSVA